MDPIRLDRRVFLGLTACAAAEVAAPRPPAAAQAASPAPSMAMGEAAGEAAAMAVRQRVPFSEVDAQALRAALKENGAVVEWT